MTFSGDSYDVVVIGGGHAGAEAAWAASNLGARTVLITMDPTKIGAMSCNPAIGGLAKGQMVREIDALGGLMGLAADATGIQFRMLNISKGPAVQGPRAQCDKYRYAREVQRLLATRANLTVIAGTVERILVEGGRVNGVVVQRDAKFEVSSFRFQDESQNPAPGIQPATPETRNLKLETLPTKAVILTTGTFMRGLMHTGPAQTPGGRVGEGTAVGISAALIELGFELGRLKTGTPPRLAAESIDFASLPIQPGDDPPQPFSDMSPHALVGGRFPLQEQRPCYLTHTNAAIHDVIRANLDRAPMYNGQIQTAGPRYCPSIEDKVVRFADRTSHHVYLEPESLDTNEIYCNGISTSLPADVQDFVVHHLPGCERAKILRYGYAVEYDMVWPHQIDATTMTKRLPGLFLAGQINGTSGYEEAAGQGLMAGLNAVRFIRGDDQIRLRRDQAYIGVMLDDLVTKTPREPYRMFTSRAEHRLLLRSDNADERLTPLGRQWGLVDDVRWDVYQHRVAALESLRAYLTTHKRDGQRLIDWARRPEVDANVVLGMFEIPLPPGEDVPMPIGTGEGLTALASQSDQDPHPVRLKSNHPLPRGEGFKADRRLISRLLADIQYAGYIERQGREIEKLAGQEQVRLPVDFDFSLTPGLRQEARQVLTKFRPATLGQAGRLAGVTPADVMVISVALGR